MAQLNKVSQKLLAFFKKNKFVLLILVIGVALLLLPTSGSKKEQKETQTPQKLTDAEYTAQMEQRLEELLSAVEGAGQVRVMLTLQTGSRTNYHCDVRSSSDTDGEKHQTSEESKTVILSEGSAYDKAAVSAVDYPQFQGALILCEGAGRSAVKLDLISAVSALTGLNSSSITVVKMN